MLRRLGREPLAQSVEPIAQRSIVNCVANPNQHAAKQLRIQRKLRCNFFAGDPLHGLLHVFFLRIAQRHCGENFHLGDTLPFPQNILKGRKNFGQLPRTLVIDYHEQKIAHDLAGAQPRGNLFRNPTFPFFTRCRTIEEIAQLRGTGIGGGEIAQLLHDRRSSALLERNIRKRVGILQARGLQLGLRCSDLTKPAMSASCVCGVNCFASRDSAPSMASFAARVLSSMRAARSAASISAFAEMATFRASDLASARIRSASAAASVCACSRKPRTSSSRRARRCSASRSLRSPSAFAACALLIIELISSAWARNFGGRIFPKSQIKATATIAKLIHLKSSVGAADAPAPLSACAAAAKNSNALHTKSDETMGLRSFIEPLAKDWRAIAESWKQFQTLVAECWSQLRGGRPATQPRHAVSPRQLHWRISRARLSIGRRAHPAVFFARLPAPRRALRALVSAHPDAA